jgi:hypothetical protein
VWNTYGPTEATVVACAARLAADEPVRIGRPLDGWQLAVVDPDGEPVEWGGTGELVIGGVGLARYLDAAKDAERFAPMPRLGWDRAYRTGDLVRAEPEGLVFVGRDDDQVKIGGRRVELGEIDLALASMPGVAAAACAVQRTAAGNPVLVGYVVLEDGCAEVDREALTRRLPAALVQRIVVLADLPTRTSGKVDRKALPWPVDVPAQSRWTAPPAGSPSSGSRFSALPSASTTTSSRPVGPAWPPPSWSRCYARDAPACRWPRSTSARPCGRWPTGSTSSPRWPRPSAR